MNVKINRIELTNFRNIDFAQYDLTDTCVIEGKNYIGKTNILLGIYWTLTDKMLDGSTNSMSLKPVKDTSKKVSVKLTLDCDGAEHTIQKSYSENWSKKRGSNELSLTGHTTDYVIDDIKQKTVNEALKEIANIIEIDPSKYFELNKIDMVQALMNPYYFSEILDWKQLRELIVNIIGDVENDEVYQKEASTLVAKEVLDKYNYNFSKALTYLNQSIQSCSITLKEKETLITELEKCEDLSEDEVKDAQKGIANINEQIENLESSGTTDINPEVESINKEIDELNHQIDDEKNKLVDDYSKSLVVYNEEMSKITDKISYLQNQLNDLNVNAIEKEFNDTQLEISRLESSLSFANEQRNKLIAEYKEIKSRQYFAVQVKCPHCGGILNEDEIAMHTKEFEEQKEKDLASNITKGKAAKLEIENTTNKIVDLKSSMIDIDKRLTEAREKSQSVQEQLNSARDEWTNQVAKKPVRILTNETINQFNLHAQKLLMRLQEIQNAPKDDIESQKRILEDSKKAFDDKLAIHYSYLENQKRLEKYQIEYQNISQEKVDLEIQKEALNLFSKTKLDLLDQKLDQAFGDVKFVLVKNNITEGSWEQVCYPKIVGKETPFINGSSSEKIITGIRVIEAFKNLLNLSDLPILVDEIGQLDNLSIAGLKVFTKAQIVSTRVSNDYSSPKIVNI